MKILIFSQHYPPEIGSPANCWGYFAPFLARRNEVTLITSVPNFPTDKIYPGFQNAFSEKKDGRLSVVRCPVVIASRASSWKRLLNYFSFVFSAAWAYLKRRGGHKVVIASAPPLFVGLLGYLANRLERKTIFVLEIRDLWPDSVIATGALKSGFAIKMGYWLERFLYERADFILANSPGQAEQLVEKKGLEPRKIKVILNGINLELFKTGTGESGLPKEKFVVFYGGNFGPAQRLETVIEAAEILKAEKDILFVLMGAGVEKEKITGLLKAKRLQNVEILAERPRRELMAFLKRADVCLVPYKNDPLFKGNIGGKVYEYLAAGCPTIVNIEGAVWEIVNKAGAGLLAEPESPESLAQKIMTLRDDRALAETLGRQAGKFSETELDQKIFAVELESWLKKIAGQSLI